MKRLFEYCIRFFQFLRGHFVHEITNCIDPAIAVVRAIKAVAEAPETDFLTHLTDSNLDDVLIEKVRALLPNLIVLLGAYKGCMQKETDSERIACFVESLSKQGPAIQSATWFKLASLLAQGLSDNELKEYQADFLVSSRYTEQKEADFSL